MKTVLTERGDAFSRTGSADRRFAYTSGQLNYIGRHPNSNVPTSNPHWLIWKVTWSGNNITRIQGPLEGKWDNRASLAW